MSDSQTTPNKKIKISDADRKSYQQSFEMAYQKGALPDFKICVEDYTWLVHSQLISNGSKFFERTCSQDFLEGVKGEVTLHDEKPAHVARLIEFLYTANYTAGSPISVSHNVPTTGFHPWTLLRAGNKEISAEEAIVNDRRLSSLQIHGEMYVIADKYEIPELEKVAMIGITRNLGDSVKSFWQVFEILKPVLDTATKDVKWTLMKALVDLCLRTGIQLNGKEAPDLLSTNERKIYDWIQSDPDVAWSLVAYSIGRCQDWGARYRTK